MAYPNDPPSEWHTGLCGCFEDCSSCLLGFFCPCILYGKNHEKITQTSGCVGPCCAYYCLSIVGCVCCLAGSTRGRLRAKYGLREQPCGDCCTYCWCVVCALCQESREVEYRLATQPPAGAYTAPQGQRI